MIRCKRYFSFFGMLSCSVNRTICAFYSRILAMTKYAFFIPKLLLHRQHIEPLLANQIYLHIQKENLL
ncbi:MAG: hypothetical protein B6D59_03015 [Campylobacteraceae bacterium 4484_4]|nr:MAG: hypothetical protein B6D59_03015 [Campylobacteraceae bacterium 4484_4]